MKIHDRHFESPLDPIEHIVKGHDKSAPLGDDFILAKLTDKEKKFISNMTVNAVNSKRVLERMRRTITTRRELLIRDIKDPKLKEKLEKEEEDKLNSEERVNKEDKLTYQKIRTMKQEMIILKKKSEDIYNDLMIEPKNLAYLNRNENSVIIDGILSKNSEPEYERYEEIEQDGQKKLVKIDNSGQQ